MWSYTPTLKGSDRIRAVDQLKREVTTLSRLRHPCILEVVEPVEESRTELVFATEHVGISLAGSISAQSNPEYQLDEVEIRKGLLQVCCIPDTARALASISARVQADSYESYAGRRCG